MANNLLSQEPSRTHTCQDLAITILAGVAGRGEDVNQGNFTKLRAGVVADGLLIMFLAKKTR